MRLVALFGHRRGRQVSVANVPASSLLRGTPTPKKGWLLPYALRRSFATEPEGRRVQHFARMERMAKQEVRSFLQRVSEEASDATALPQVTPALVAGVPVFDASAPFPDCLAAPPSPEQLAEGSVEDEESILLVRDPSTGALIGRTPNIGSRWLPLVIRAAETAQRTWASTPVIARSNLLLRWNALVEDLKEPLAELITAESGKPLAEARQEVLYAASYIRWCAESVRFNNGLQIPSADGSRVQLTFHEPLGVCALITPFNFPFAMVARKASAALAAGNACIVRPSEETPLSALALCKLALESGLPGGLMSVLPSSRMVASKFAEEVCRSPSVKLLSFTGSTRVGVQLYRQCAATVKRLQLELGGNAPFVVFDDADISEAVMGLLAAKLRCAGQTCVSPNRVYVHRSVFDEFCKKTVKLFGEQTLGSGRTHGVSVGPLINEAAVHRVEDLVADALKEGAKLLLGGSRPSLSGSLKKGSFYSVTVLDCRNASSASRVRHEELFAPVVCLYDFESDEEAEKLANSTTAGLAAYFYTRDVKRAHRFARQLQFGLIGVNTGKLSSCEVPFGGCKESGFGREGSVLALDDYTTLKLVAIDTTAS